MLSLIVKFRQIFFSPHTINFRSNTNATINQQCWAALLWSWQFSWFPVWVWLQDVRHLLIHCLWRWRCGSSDLGSNKIIWFSNVCTFFSSFLFYSGTRQVGVRIFFYILLLMFLPWLLCNPLGLAYVLRYFLCDIPRYGAHKTHKNVEAEPMVAIAMIIVIMAVFWEKIILQLVKEINK